MRAGSRFAHAQLEALYEFSAAVQNPGLPLQAETSMGQPATPPLDRRYPALNGKPRVALRRAIHRLETRAAIGRIQPAGIPWDTCNPVIRGYRSSKTIDFVWWVQQDSNLRPAD